MKEKQLRKAVLKAVANYYKGVFANEPFHPGKTPIKTGGRVFDERELVALVDASLDYWLTEGRFARKFTDAFSAFLHIPYSILTNSGSSANLLAFAALTSQKLGTKRLKTGDEVISTAASFPATINPIIQYQCIPVLLDIDLETLNIDTSLLEKAVTKKTKAILVAHALGNPFDLETIMRIARKHNLWVIEDCCDALGARYKRKFVGTFGDMATFSFYPAHHITTGEGGAVVTKNGLLRDIVVSLREWGREWAPQGYRARFGAGKVGKLPLDYDHRFIYTHAGYNLKVTDMQASLGVAQLKKFPQFMKQREENFVLLLKGLEAYQKYFLFHTSYKGASPCWFGFPCTVRKNAPFSRGQLIKYLAGKNIDVRLFFAGNITKQPYFASIPYRAVGSLKNTDFVMTNTFWIGSYPGITKEMIAYVLATFDSFIKLLKI